MSRLCLILILILASGCATERYIGPTHGRSAGFQIATTNAFGKVLNKISFDLYQGKDVYIEVFTLTERYADKSPEEEYIKSWIAEKVVQNGGRVVDSETNGDIKLSILARSIGINKTRRDLLPIYYGELTKGIVDLHITAYDTKKNIILFTSDEKDTSTYREAYFFYMIGPFVFIK